MRLEDGNTFNYGYISSRASGNEGGSDMVVWPNWKGEKPAGIDEVFHSTTESALTGFRTPLFNPEDMPDVVKIQAGYKPETLSAFLKQPTPAAAPAIDFPKIDKAMVKSNFFEYLDFALQFAPAGPEEKEVRAKLARIGIGAGKTFDFKDLSLEHKAGIYGNDAIEACYPMTRVDVDGDTLDGSKHNYTLTFPAGDMPPVNHFGR